MLFCNAKKEFALALLMKSSCERCRASLPARAAAYICSFECTYCPDCAEALHRNCPNCQGELVMRPRRAGVAPLPEDD